MIYKIKSSNTLKRITLDTNPEDCNLHCIMCEEHSEFSDFKQKLFEKTGIKRRLMPKEWIENIFLEAKNLGVEEIIPSTMGEPLLYQHTDLFFELAKKYQIKINLTTNGTFPKKTVQDWAKLIIPVTSDTKISINGATAKTAENIMQGIDFQQQIQNIREFVNYRNQHFTSTGFYSRITFQLTFMQNNMHELPEIVKLAAKLGIDRIKGHHLWTHFDEIKPFSFENSLESRQKWNELVEKTHEAIEKYRLKNGNKIVLENFTPFQLEKLSAENEIPENYECPFLEKELWISATGKISPCCAPDELRNSLGDFGNYPQNKLIEVLNSEKYVYLVQNYKSHNLCKTCVMRRL